MKRRYGANQLSCCAGLTELGHTEMCGIAHFKFSTTESHFCPRSYRRLTAPRLIEAVEPGASDYARERPLLSTSTGGGRFPRAVCRSVALHGLRFQEAKKVSRFRSKLAVRSRRRAYAQRASSRAPRSRSMGNMRTILSGAKKSYRRWLGRGFRALRPDQRGYRSRFQLRPRASRHPLRRYSFGTASRRVPQA